jgi:hypothetical protein
MPRGGRANEVGHGSGLPAIGRLACRAPKSPLAWLACSHWQPWSQLVGSCGADPAPTPGPGGAAPPASGAPPASSPPWSATAGRSCTIWLSPTWPRTSTAMIPSAAVAVRSDPNIDRPRCLQSGSVDRCGGPVGHRRWRRWPAPASTRPPAGAARCTSAACRTGCPRHGCARSATGDPPGSVLGCPAWRSRPPCRVRPGPAGTAGSHSRRPDAPRDARTAGRPR